MKKEKIFTGYIKGFITGLIIITLTLLLGNRVKATNHITTGPGDTVLPANTVQWPAQWNYYDGNALHAYYMRTYNIVGDTVLPPYSVSGWPSGWTYYDANVLYNIYLRSFASSIVDSIHGTYQYLPVFNHSGKSIVNSWFKQDSSYSYITSAVNAKLITPATFLLQNNAIDTAALLLSGSDGIRLSTDHNTMALDMSFGTHIINLTAPTGLQLSSGLGYAEYINGSGIYAPNSGSKQFNFYFASGNHNVEELNFKLAGWDNRLGIGCTPTVSLDDSGQARFRCSVQFDSAVVLPHFTTSYTPKHTWAIWGYNNAGGDTTLNIFNSGTGHIDSISLTSVTYNCNPQGFSSVSSSTSNYDLKGNIVYVKVVFWGISNATTMSFSLPFNALKTDIVFQSNAENNSSNVVACILTTTAGSNTCTCNFGVLSGYSSTGWSSTGVKGLAVQFRYTKQ